ncbi:hypothetical protein GGS20DRAFT_305526 [Poronia punctata]|nr:hypothetical protein GGS20DRAFT_305526 [Poronia punctata]
MMDDTGSSGGVSGSSKVAAAVKRIPKKLPQKLAANRHWKKRASNASNDSFPSSMTSNEEYARGRSSDGREPPEAVSQSTKQSSEYADDNGEAGYDTAHDSEIEDLIIKENSALEQSSSRPAVPSTHPSQIGHLTTSSPIIQSDHLPEVQTSDQQETLDSLSRSATLSVASSEQSHEPAHGLSTSKTGLHLPSNSSPRRSKSPGGRLKNAFRGMRNSSAATSNDSLNDHQDQATAATAATRTGSRPSSAVQAASDSRGSDLSSKDPSQKKNQLPSEISTRPQTPPNAESPRPVIVNTPPTPTEQRSPNSFTLSNPNVVVSHSGNMISHRRTRSGSAASIGPSKLSTITSAPLTPTPENAVLPTPGTGFFSSVLSAAQNAANTLSSTITNTNINPGGNKSKPTTSKPGNPGNDDSVEVESPAEEVKTSDMDGKEPAVKTLGTGDLSLSQLGFQEAASAPPTAESRARSDSAPADSETGFANNDGTTDNLGVDRPRSPYEYSNASPTSSIYDGGSGVHRASSIRSAISRRRKRGSTVGTSGTGNTASGAAAVSANASGVAHPSAAGSTAKLTGFAVASKKRNRDFHALFKSVPDDDFLIEDYSCALQREILAHGRLYVSEGHLCFSSNILGWVTTLVMSFDEIVSVEKRSTALVFKNGLMISTLHAKHVFASFASRDSTYDLIVSIWKLGRPTLRSSLNGVTIDETGGDKTELGDERAAGTGDSQSTSDSEDDDSEEDDVYDEDLEEEDTHEETQQTEPNPADTDGDKAVPRKVSGAAALNGGAGDKADASPSTGGADFPGPATHGPTECGDADTHFEVPVGDDIVAAPLGKVYDLIFGPASVAFMSKWLTNDQKCTELQMEDKKGLSSDNKSRVYSYIKPLYASLGPKQTKCIVTETIETIDLEKSVNVLIITQTPDVPNGNLFSVKTKYCLFWAENNSTRVTINCTIEWTGKSWLKGAIEKGAKDGQAQYSKELFASLKSAVSSRPRTTTLNGAGKGKKRRAKGKPDQPSKDPHRGATDSTSAKSQDWGLFEPIHGVLGPIFDILQPVMTGNVVYGLLVGLLVSSWFGFGFNGQRRGVGYGRDMAFSSYPDRAVAYEEIWRREESELWDWLEERVGLHRMNEGAAPIRKRAAEPRTMEERLREERMSEREVEEAIKITEEKLNILKSVMDRRKDDAETTTGHTSSVPITNTETES